MGSSSTMKSRRLTDQVPRVLARNESHPLVRMIAAMPPVKDENFGTYPSILRAQSETLALFGEELPRFRRNLMGVLRSSHKDQKLRAASSRKPDEDDGPVTASPEASANPAVLSSDGETA